MSKENEINETVYEDGDAKLFFWKPHPEETFALFGLSDGGGYSSVLMTRTGWHDLREKMDALVEKHLSK